MMTDKGDGPGAGAAGRDAPRASASIRVFDVEVHYFDVATSRFSCGATSARPQWTLQRERVTCARCREFLGHEGADGPGGHLG